MTFTMNRITLKASKIDRKFSYANLCKTIERNKAERDRQQTEQQRRQAEAERISAWAQRQRQEIREYLQQIRKKQQTRQERTDPIPAGQRPGQRFMSETGERIREQAANMPEPITEIRGMKLSPEQQKQLYSPQGLTHGYVKNGYRNTSLFRVNRTPGRDILTEELLSQEKIKRNPAVYGIRLTDKQVQDIKDGEYAYLENMQEDDGTLFSGYLVMPDDMKQGWIYQSPPDRIVKEDKFYIREMDKLLADQGYVVRAKVRFWGPEQPESRQYFWKESTGFYDCSYDDPRKPKPKQSREEELHVPSVTPKKKQGGPKL